MKIVKVTTGEGVEYVPTARAFDIQTGVLILFSDPGENVVVKAYNAQAWGYVEWVDPSEVPS